MLGQGLPLLVGLITIPIVAGRLGDVRFGLLGLAWAVLGLAGAFDMGLGRATVRFAADHFQAGRAAAFRQIVTASSLLQLVLGAVAGAIVAGCTPLIVSRVLGVPPSMQSEARAAFFLLAAMLPFVLLVLNLRGVLEAAQRFDLANAIRVAGSSAVFALPAIGAGIGLRLPGIMVLLLAGRIVTCGAAATLLRRAVAAWRWELPTDWRSLIPLASFSGWVAVSNVLSPVLVYLDRFLLGAVAGVTAVAYYTAPFEAVSRLSIVPAGLATALFPTFTVLSVRGEHGRLTTLLARSLRHLVLILAVPAMLLMVFAHDLLALWLGDVYADQATLAVRILTLGIFVNALAHLPHGFLQAIGRPDLTAKFHLVELPIYGLAAWWLVGAYGIPGAAAAWACRATVDAVFLFGGVWRVAGTSPRRLAAELGMRAAVVLAGLAAVLAGTTGLNSVIARVAVAAGFSCAAVVTIWSSVLRQGERAAVLLVVKGLLARPRAQ